MGIGIGIFLGLCFVGLVYLYTQTKNEWDWKKIWKRVGMIFAFIVFLPIILFALIQGYESFNSYLDNKPKKITSLHGVSLGDSLSDVKFKLGVVFDKEVSGIWESKVYLTDNKNLLYEFSDQDRLKTIGQRCVDEKKNSINIQSINGISCNANGDQVLEKYGKESIRILCHKTSTENSRAYDAIDYGIRHILDSDQVGLIYIKTPEDLKTLVGKTWIPCDQVVQVTPKK
jgi:hypothetical protein